MLNIRDESHRGVVQTELHTEYHESMIFAVPVWNKDGDTQGSAEWPRRSSKERQYTDDNDASAI